MSRTIPVALQTAFDSRTTTLTQLLRIEPVDGAPFGLCLTNQDITYDDGHGAITYKSLSGFDDPAYEQSSGREVDNAEARVLFAPTVGDGITLDMVRAGKLDDARFRVLLVDYENLAAGHAIIEWGVIGVIHAKNGQSATVELRGAQQLARQRAVCERGSKTCRATFGDPSTGCHFSLSGVGGSDSVTSVGAEADRIFLTPAPIPAPGLVTFTSGDNIGIAIEVESVDTAGNVSLMFPAPFAITAGDTFDWRPDCDKQFSTCKAFGQASNFRGEPWRPEAIGDALQFPGGAT